MMARLISSIKTSAQTQSLIVAIVAACLWWGVGLAVRGAGLGLVWGDQHITFLKGWQLLSAPYTVPRFVNPPWASLLLYPLSFFPFDLAILLQMMIYFCLLTLIIFKFAPKEKSDAWKRAMVLVTLTCPFAFDTAIEINIDWIVCLGLIVPPAWSGLFLTVKPQNALGYVLSLPPRLIARWIGLLAGGILASFALWGFWLIDLLHSYQRYSVAQTINVAPLSLMPLPLALSIGLVLLIYGIYKRDAVWTILAGLFFVPYIASYSILLHYALLTSRFPRAMLFISIGAWVTVGITWYQFSEILRLSA